MRFAGDFVPHCLISCIEMLKSNQKFINQNFLIFFLIQILQLLFNDN
jgi:hypothetical protein